MIFHLMLLIFMIQDGKGETRKVKEGLFTSNVDLQNLVMNLKEIIPELKSYIHMEETRLDKLKRYVKEYENIYQEAETNEAKYVENPINSFRLIKSLTSDWEKVKTLANASNMATTVFFENINRTTDNFYLFWPTHDDLSGAVMAIKRLQDTYRVKTSDMAEGKLSKKSQQGKLTASDCYQIGYQLLSSREKLHAIEWLEYTVTKLDQEGESATVDRIDVYDHLASAFIKMEDAGKVLYYLNLKLPLKPNDKDARLKQTIEAYMNTTIPMKEKEVHERYMSLCRDEGQIDIRTKSKLICKYNYGFNDYLKFMPAKEEIMSYQPKISVFHDVMSDSELDMIKNETFEELERGLVISSDNKHIHHPGRISQTAWLDRSYIEKISARVSHITGLDMEYAESLQISSYGIGGYYKYHEDFLDESSKKSLQKSGNRIATWMFYGSDVELGGATVFLDPNVTVFPKKGSAVFWYNLHRNGSADLRTYHAACPVLVGSKWVGNYWIREYGQEFKCPCFTNQFQDWQ